MTLNQDLCLRHRCSIRPRANTCLFNPDVPNADCVFSDAELYAEFRTARLTKIIFDLASQFEFKEGHPPPLKINIYVNDINNVFCDIWTSIDLECYVFDIQNTCYASRYTLMMEYVILCGGHIGFQDGRHLNSDYNNDYIIIRHILSNEYFYFRVYKYRIIY